MEPIFEFLNYAKAFFSVKINSIKIAIQKWKYRRCLKDFDESRFYPKELKICEEADEEARVGGPGLYLSKADAMCHGAHFKAFGDDDGGAGLYY